MRYELAKSANYTQIRKVEYKTPDTFYWYMTGVVISLFSLFLVLAFKAPPVVLIISGVALIGNVLGALDSFKKVGTVIDHQGFGPSDQLINVLINIHEFELDNFQDVLEEVWTFLNKK